MRSLMTSHNDVNFWAVDLQSTVIKLNFLKECITENEINLNEERSSILHWIYFTNIDLGLQSLVDSLFVENKNLKSLINTIILP